MTLQVACEGFVISNSVIFEYKKPPSDENKVKEVQYTAVFFILVFLLNQFCYNIREHYVSPLYELYFIVFIGKYKIIIRGK